MPAMSPFMWHTHPSQRQKTKDSGDRWPEEVSEQQKSWGCELQRRGASELLEDRPHCARYAQR